MGPQLCLGRKITREATAVCWGKAIQGIARCGMAPHVMMIHYV